MHGFHIHFATERYQLIGMDEEAYAEETTRYANLREAFDCMLDDCSFIMPDELQTQMFKPEIA